MLCKTTLRRYLFLWMTMLLLPAAVLPSRAQKKDQTWAPRAVESYPARLTSEGVTIAVDPLFTDELAARVFDRKDFVSHRVVPVAIIIQNENDYPVEVEPSSVAVQGDGDSLEAMTPDAAIERLAKGERIRAIGIPGGVKIKLNKPFADLLQDLQRKWLGYKKVAPHSTAGGFLYFPVQNPDGLRSMLAGARVYIPEIFRTDKGSPLIFFEIDLKPAVDAAPRK